MTSTLDRGSPRREGGPWSRLLTTTPRSWTREILDSIARRWGDDVSLRTDSQRSAAMESRPVTAPPVPLDEQPSIHARRWFLLAVMCLSLVLVVMSVAGLNTALPTIQRNLGASASDLQWIVDAYAIVFAGLLLSRGAIGARFVLPPALPGGLSV